LKNLKKPLQQEFDFQYESPEDNKMYTYVTKPKKDSYTNIEELITDVNNDIDKIIPHVDAEIVKEQLSNPDFIAHRWTKEEFDKLVEKLEKRISKPDETSVFEGFIEKVKNLLANENNTDFHFQKVHNNYVWVKDSQNIIGNRIAHYEIVIRRGNINVELHFEDAKTKNQFKSLIGGLPNDIEWFKWSSAESIRTKESINIKNEKATELIKNQLILIEKLIGNKARNVLNQIKNNSPQDQKWLELKTTINKLNNQKQVINFFDSVKYVLKTLKIKPDDEILYSSSLNNSLQITIGNFYVTKLRKYKGNLLIGYYIPVEHFSKLNSKYNLITNENSENKSNEVIWVETKTDTLNINDFLPAITERAKAIKNNQNKSPFNTTWEEKANKWIPLVALDENLRAELFDDQLVKTNTFEMKEPVNTILYGPPGTGKTYKLKTEYFPKYTTKETSISPEKHFENTVNELTWWQVIALAMLELKKSKVSQIFESKWVQTKAGLSESKTVRPTLWSQLQSHTIEECEFVNVKSRQTPFIFNKTEDSHWEILEEEVKEQTPELYDILDSVNNFNPSPDKEIKRYVFTTFHQSYAYEEFIEGIKPVLGTEEESTELNYTIEPGIFKQLCKDAENDPEHRYAIFIDEINRGNVSNVFGELITLIETDKRKGATNEMSATLPYSKNEFNVPNNLDIYGTMNTADRSVEALDTALRRRFSFVEMLPDPSILKTEQVGDIMLSDVLTKINERVEVLVDRDHTIGHSYFIGVDTEEKLANAFKDNITPLLQEYFYGDYGKIGLVLGKGFVEKVKGKNDVFAGFEYDGQTDFITDSFVLNRINSDNIVSAVSLLLNNKTEKK